MKGHVPTPSPIVDGMVERLFAKREPRADDVVLEPGCGDGPFIDGILRYCGKKGLPIPHIIGVDSDPKMTAKCTARFAQLLDRITIVCDDYLDAPFGPVDFIVGNPPYVSITGLDSNEKARYRARFASAVGRFDLYLLFFEQSLLNLKAGGRLVFITPEKYAYVHTAAPLRRLLAKETVQEIHHLDEDSFPGLVTFPTITTLDKTPPESKHVARVHLRDGRQTAFRLPPDGAAWSAHMAGEPTKTPSTYTLGDACVRVSCGVATGLDEVFVLPDDRLPKGLRPFAHPTVSGRQLGTGALTSERTIKTRDVMLIPYRPTGELFPEDELGDLGTYLGRPDHARKLKERTCVTEGGRVWYRFHDNVPFQEMLRPKILFKDIAQEPRFWADREGKIVPRHSVYYAVPHASMDFERLLAYLNGEEARAWLMAHCQKAANGFLRIQSTVIKKLPLPEDFFNATSPLAKSKSRPMQTALAVE